MNGSLEPLVRQAAWRQEKIPHAILHEIPLPLFNLSDNSNRLDDAHKLGGQPTEQALTNNQTKAKTLPGYKTKDESTGNSKN